MTVLAAWPRSGYLPASPNAEDPPPGEEPPPPGDGTAAPPWIDHPGTDATINRLLVHDGVVHIAHGGWSGGSHHLIGVDLATSMPWTGPLAPSEGFLVVREYDGVIYLPWQDPVGSWYAPQGYSYSTDGGATWQTQLVANSYHWFDLVEHAGDLFIAGSGPRPADGGQSAIVYRSSDSGASWRESLRLPASEGGTPRVYALVQAAGSLWVEPSGASPAAAFRLDGEAWATEAPLGLALSAPGLAVGGVYYGRDYAFDGTRAVPTYARIPLWSDATHVYALNQMCGRIERSPILTPEATSVDWQPWLDLGEGLRGLHVTTATLHDGYVYVGGTKGRIWRYQTDTGTD